MPTAAGLDIARGKWALVEILWDDGQELQLTGKTIPYGQLEFRDVWDVVIADVPIGLVQDHEAAASKRGRSGDRPVDRGARRWCRSSSSVFPPPTEGQFQTGLQEHRRAAAALTKTEQRRKLEAVVPGGLSKQSFELLPAIDDAAKLKSHHRAHVFESHPEVVFSVLAGGVVPVSKGSPTGALYRAAALAARLNVPALRWVLEREADMGVPVVDWLDAMSMAVVALDWINSPERRQILAEASGRVALWQNDQPAQIMALPNTNLETPPRPIEPRTVIKKVFQGLQM